jgi:hypothetical protein
LRIFFDFWRIFFLEKEMGSLIDFFAIKKKKTPKWSPFHRKILPTLATP